MIDDISYLIENAQHDSRIIYIDSSKRNKIFSPNPSEYILEFDQPFKLVYGFEILDATIPVTMYNVDIYNNSIYYAVVKIINNTQDPKVYFNEISKSATFSKLFNSDTEYNIAIGEESVLNAFYEIDTQFQEESKYKMVYKSVITTTDIQIFDKQSLSEIFKFHYDYIDYCILKTKTDLIEIISKGDFYMSFGEMETSLTIFEYIDIAEEIYNSIVTTDSSQYTINIKIGYLETGNHDILSIISDLNTVLLDSEISIESVSSNPTKKYKIQVGSTNYFVINSDRGKLVKTLGFDLYPSKNDIQNYEPISIGSNSLIFGSVYDSIRQEYVIYAPGLVNLLGERYMILRIKEIEDHLNGSFAYMNLVPGVAMFKIAEPFGGVTNLRFDFGSVLKKPFHPIGKLFKLTIRFETSDGELYDFKGVNHQMMINIKFYTPIQKIHTTKSYLNPNYNPDVMQYLATNRGIEYKEDDDDDEQEDDEKDYQKDNVKYDVSDSEDESFNSDDSEEHIDFDKYYQMMHQT